MAESVIQLAKPYTAQQELIKQFRRNNLLILSRRWGKTTLCGRIHVHSSLTKSHNRAAWSSPTWKLMMEAFEHHRTLLEPAISRVSREDRRIELINGSVLEYWSSDDISAGRGRKYHTWVADESQRQRNLAKFIRGAVRPTLADFRGTLYVMATANGEGSELHDFYLECLADPSWFVGSGRLEDNPYIDPDEIAQMRKDLGPELAAQELDSQWVRVDGVTPLVRISQWNDLFEERDNYTTKRVLAVDASINSDTTAVVGVWRDANDFFVDYNDIRMFQPDAVLGEIDFTALENHLWDLWRTGRYATIAYDPYQLVSLMQRLKAKGIHTTEFTQNSMRMKGDGFLRQLINEGRVHHPAHELLTEHILNATLKFTNDQFRLIKPTKAKKIDLAVALSMACWSLNILPEQMMGSFTPVVHQQTVLPTTSSDSPFGYDLSSLNPFTR